jgi:hypothetical protein
MQSSTSRRVIAALSVIAALVALPASAHHSVAAWFDSNRTQDIEGIVTEIKWENPHVRFFMRTTGADGEELRYEIETLSVSGISRWGVTADLLAIGDRVRVSGSPSRRGLENLFVRNVLLPSGQELVFGGEAIYSDNALRGGEALQVEDGVAADPERGIFKVWSTGRNGGQVFPEAFDNDFDFGVYPLTAAARAAVDAFNYIEQDPTNDCTPKGMPVIMEQPYPIQFLDEDDRIRMLIEEYDQVRMIHLRNAPDAATVAPSPLGFSTGHIEGRDLIVTTTRVNSGTFDSVGVPLSLDAELTERFSPSADGSTLTYTLIVNDPINFTAPVETGKRFIYLPDATVRRFNCTE